MTERGDLRISAEMLRVACNSSSPFPAGLHRQIDQICVHFEQQWHSKQLTIESLLEQSDTLYSASLLEQLLAIELELRWSNGESPGVGEYQQRFPDHKAVVAATYHRVRQDCRDRVLTPATQLGGDTKTDVAATAEHPNIPGYDVLSLLGRGGMGVVYRARQIRLNRQVALKVIGGGRYASAIHRERFQVEGEIVAGFAHPNIAHVYDAGEVGGIPYLASELVEGGTLADLSFPLAIHETKQLVATIAEALSIAHENGVIHRDLKPANILLSENARGLAIGNRHVTPKITDFGLAFRSNTADSGQQKMCGTPNYMAPEQLDGIAVSETADIHALGVILYELLTGSNPFQADSISATVEQLQTQVPPAPSSINRNVPRKLDAVCLRCLRKDPDERWPSASELAAALLNEAEPEPKSWTRPVVLLLALAVCSVLGVWAMSGKTQETPTATMANGRVGITHAAQSGSTLASLILNNSNGLIMLGSAQAMVPIRNPAELADHADEVVRVRLPMHQKFTAAQRTELASWKSLLELEAAHTEFCDEDASVLVGLEGLQRLDLFASRVTSKSISSLVQLRSLQYLSIGATRVSMKDLTGLSHLPIEELNLVGRNLDEVDAIHSLSQLPHLHTLQVVQCSQSQLQQVVQLKSLRELRLFPLPLDPTAFSTLGRLPKLECLRLSVGAPVSTLDFTELSSLQIIEIRLEFSPATLPELKLAESTKVLSFFGPIVGLDEFVAQHPNLTVWHNASRYQTP